MSSFRITTNGLVRNYRTNLYNSTKKVEDSMTQVQTGRIFNSYAEDPAAASKAFQLRRTFWRTGDQIDNSNYVISKFQTGWDALDEIVDGTSEHRGLSGIDTALAALNGTAGSTRSLLGREMMTTADAVVMLMSTEYNDTFVFAGADGLNAPFDWSEDGSTLLYRGYDVSLPKPKTAADFNVENVDPKMEQPLTETEFANSKLNQANLTEPKTRDDFVYYADFTAYQDSFKDDKNGYTYEQAVEAWNRSSATYAEYQADYETRNDTKFEDAAIDYENLRKFEAFKTQYETENGLEDGDFEKVAIRFDEATYVDIGLGMKAYEDGTVIPSTAFNSALSGMEILGYGTDEDGFSKNLVALMRDLGALFNSTDPDTGAYPDTYTYNGKVYSGKTVEDLANTLAGKLHTAIGRVQEQHVNLDARVNYLKTNKGQLESKQATLDEEIANTETKDMAESILEMNWAQYCYNAALRIGSSILSQSLMDYLS